jgi:hypothetical protein
MESMMSAEYEAVRVSIKCGHFLTGYEYLIFIFSNTHSRKQYHTHTKKQNLSDNTFLCRKKAQHLN